MVMHDAHSYCMTSCVQGLLLAAECLKPAHFIHCCREGGWAGAAFSSSRPGTLAVARGCARDITLFTGATRQRTLRTGSQPYAVAFLDEGGCGGGGGDLLAAAEGHVVRAAARVLPLPAACRAAMSCQASKLL